MPSIEDAIALAALAHKGQHDKAGKPYVFHPLRMMLRAQGEVERMAAVLHDVVEDTQHTLDGLRELGYSEEVVSAVDALTRREEETYEEFVERASHHPVARQVKVLDLQDNMDLSRIAEPSQKDLDRMDRYRRALAVLKA